MDTARVVALTVMCVFLAFFAAVAMFMWGRSATTDDCERYGKFYDGERVFECSEVSK